MNNRISSKNYFLQKKKKERFSQLNKLSGNDTEQNSASKIGKNNLKKKKKELEKRKVKWENEDLF